ncbi:MAG TPA: hypothetical protein VLA23_06125, partial [Candidatus Limnocylindrales bacterium]|nr:hypothetical protein [Candidatus Limnocylindrales bacterium]
MRILGGGTPASREGRTAWFAGDTHAAVTLQPSLPVSWPTATSVPSGNAAAAPSVPPGRSLGVDGGRRRRSRS